MLGTPCLPRHARRAVVLGLHFLALVLWLGASLPAQGMQVLWGDPPVVLPVEAEFAGTTLMVPVDLVAQLGGSVRRTGNSLEADLGGRTLRFTVGQTEAHLDGRTVALPRAPELRSDVAWVPLRSLADHLLEARLAFAGGAIQLVPWQPLTAPAPVAGPAAPALPAPGPAASGGSSGDDNGTPAAGRLEEDLPALAAVAAGAEGLPAGAGAFAADLRNGPALGPLAAVPTREVGASRRPRLDVLFPARVRAPARVLPPVKATVLRAERLDWVEASLVEGTAGKEAVLIRGSKAFTYKTFLLTDPARLVIDLSGLDTGHAAEPLNVYGANLQRVRLNQNAPYVVRVVLDLADTAGYTVTPLEDGKALKVELHHVVRRIETQFGPNSGTVRLDIPRTVRYEVLRLTDPERLVIDLIDTTLGPMALPELPPQAPIRNWRVQQFDASRTRIVFEIDRHLDIAQNPQEALLTFQIGHQVRGVGYAVLPGVGFAVHIDGAYLPQPQTMYLAEPDRLVIDLPGTVLTEPLQDMLIDAELAWRIRTGQHPDMVRIVLDLNSAVEYAWIPLPADLGLALVVLPPSLEGRSVFLDPGHGGHDPGTIGRALGLLEKDVVLDVALRLRDLLAAAGATVYMSREDDRFVDLQARPAAAHQVNADVFLSIHANASTTNFSAGGTETYIHVRPAHGDSARFAFAVHRHLVGAAGLANRGVKAANFAVLRYARIPAALVEIAFLSKEEEEFLLGEAWFRQLVAQGLFNGIVAYFSEGASRAADLDPAVRSRMQEGILSALVNERFAYLPLKAEPGRSDVGVVRVRPL